MLLVIAWMSGLMMAPIAAALTGGWGWAAACVLCVLQVSVIGRLLGGGNGQSRRLGSRADGETLIRMLETGRCHWRNAASPPLTRPGPSG